jgi:hypothetical protein
MERIDDSFNYSRFYGLIEAQSLGVVLPNLHARRTKFAHRVYTIWNYRMRDRAASALAAVWMSHSG